MKRSIIVLFGLLVICAVVVIFCCLHAAEYQEDWDKYDDGEGDQIDGE